MHFPYFVRYLAGGLFLALVLLAGCQRASYSFQLPSGAASVAGVKPPAGLAPADAPAASATGAPTGRKFPSAVRPRALHRAVARPRSAAAAARARPMPRATGRVVRATHQANHRTAAKAAAAPREPGPGRHRSKGIALLLALLLGAFGAHRFYLGYYGEGAAYVALTAFATLFLMLGLLSLIFASTSYSGFLVVGVVLIFLMQGWLLADIVRIITGSLKPKNGEYFPRFFQASSDASPSPDAATK